MKRKLWHLILLLCCAAVLLTACGRAEKLSGSIAHIYGGTLLIAGEDGELYSAAVGAVDTGGEKLAPGQKIELTYKSAIRETYPMQLGDVQEIAVTGEAGNLIDVYVAMIAEALQQQEEQPTEFLAYDFFASKRLTAGEQQAVGYLCWTEMDYEPYFGTQEELTEQGVIRQEGEKAVLRNGWLMTFADDEKNPDVLQITLWRNDHLKATCRFTLAEESPGEWTYQPEEKKSGS